MGEKIVDDEFRVAFVFSDIDADNASVLFDKNAVKGERGRRPLILSYTAVVMGLEKTEFDLLVKRIGFQIETGRIDMRGSDVYTAFTRLFTDDRKGDRLAAVVEIYPVSGIIFFALLKGNKALFFGKRNGGFDRFSFGFCRVKERFITRAKLFGLDHNILIDPQKSVFSVK